MSREAQKRFGDRALRLHWSQPHNLTEAPILCLADPCQPVVPRTWDYAAREPGMGTMSAPGCKMDYMFY